MTKDEAVSLLRSANIAVSSSVIIAPEEPTAEQNAAIGLLLHNHGFVVLSAKSYREQLDKRSRSKSGEAGAVLSDIPTVNPLISKWASAARRRNEMTLVEKQQHCFSSGHRLLNEEEALRIGYSKEEVEEYFKPEVTPAPVFLEDLSKAFLIRMIRRLIRADLEGRKQEDAGNGR